VLGGTPFRPYAHLPALPTSLFLSFFPSRFSSPPVSAPLRTLPENDPRVLCPSCGVLLQVTRPLSRPTPDEALRR